MLEVPHLARGPRALARDELAPATLPAAAAVLGSWLGDRHADPAMVMAAASLGAAALLGALLALSRRRRRAALALFALALGLVGAARSGRCALRGIPALLAQALQVSEREEEAVEITGLLRSQADVAPERYVLDVDVESVRALGSAASTAGRVRLSVRRTSGAPPARLDAGRRISAWARLRPPSFARNPGGADDERLLRSRGIDLRGSVKSDRLLVVGERVPGNPWREACRMLRAAAIAKISSAFPEERSRADGALVAAFLVGDRSGLAEEDVEAFRDGGTYHVLAISGLHVALAASLLLGALSLVGFPGYRARYLLVVVAVALYVGVAEAPPSAVRAGVAGAIGALGRMAGERVRALPLLGVTLAGCLLADPASLHDAGFQLTYAATAGIVLLGLPGGPLHALLAPLPEVVRQPIAVTAAAQLSTLPLIHATFLRLCPGGLAANLVAVPAAAAAMGAGIAGLLLPGAPGRMLLRLAAWLLRVIAHLSRLVGEDAHLSFPAAAPPGWLLAWSATGLLLVALLADPGAFLGSRPRGRWVGSHARGAAALALAAAVVAHHAAGARGFAPRELEVTVLDVGQGDAIVVRDARGATMVVDAGGDPEGAWDVGRNVVLPALLSLGATRVDVLVLTHAHPDHGAGMPALLEELPVGEMWEGVPPREVRPDGFYGRIVELARRRGVPRRRVAIGDRRELLGAVVEVRNPPPDRPPSSKVRNDDSVALLLRSGAGAMLLTGDLEAEGELAVARELPRCDALKVAHHGSDTSTTPELLARAAPRISVISVGDRNLWGFPRPDVLARLAGSVVLRTDREGAVRVSLGSRGVGATSVRRLRLGAPPFRWPRRGAARATLRTPS